MACVYRAITLQSGESYVLPAGAELVSSTNPNLITAENGCADTDNLEEFLCYGCEFNVTDSNPVSAGEVPQGSKKYVRGLKIRGVEYLFDVSIVVTEGISNIAMQNSLVARINSLSINGAFLDICAGKYYIRNQEGQGEWWRFVFKTLESLVDDDSYLIVESDGGEDNNYIITKEYAPILPFNQLSLSINSGVCACTTTT